MCTRRLLSALLAFGLCSTSALTAQSALTYPQSGSPPVESNSKLNALRAIVMMNQNRVSALSYLYDHPLFVSPNAIGGQQRGILAPVMSETPLAADRRPECPMPVAKAVVKNDSMAVRTRRSETVEAMPVSPSLCVNPLSAKP